MDFKLLWEKFTLIGTDELTSDGEKDKATLLNQVLGFLFLPASVTLLIYTLVDNYVMAIIDITLMIICLSALLVTYFWNYKAGWHFGLITCALILTGASFLVNPIPADAIIVGSFIIISHFIYENQKIRYFYYAFFTICVMAILLSPLYPYSSKLDNPILFNSISGVIGMGLQILFSILYSKRVKRREFEVAENQEKISHLLVELRDKNRELEQKVNERTERLEKSNEELQRSNLDLEQFAYAASHDLQEPLRTIGNFVQLLERRFGDKLGDEGKEYIFYASDGAQRMSVLIKDLLEYSRVGRKEAEMKNSDLSLIFDSKLRDLNQKIKEKNAEVIQVGLPTELVCVPNQISILLYNLINNGLKFNTSEIPKIELRGMEREDHWLFTVTDNGIGIAEDYKDKIFEIFRRLHGREEYAGSGIGLAICKKIVLRHEGEIWVESEIGNGTTFFFTIKKVNIEELVPSK